MPRRLIALFTLFLTCVSSQAQAAAPGKKLAVLEVRSIGNFDPKEVQGLATLMATEAERHGFRVVSSQDIHAMLGFDRQKTLLGCSDQSCLAEIGGALGVDYLLSSEVSAVGGVWLITATLIDVPRSRPVKRVTNKVKALGELVDAAQSAVRETLTPFAPRAPAPVPATTVQAATPKPSGSPLRTAGLVLDAAGAAMIAGGAVYGALALKTYNDGKTASAADLPGLRATGKSRALTADVLYGVGAAALVTGLALTFLGPDPEAENKPTLSPTPISGGGALAVTGRF